MIEKEDLSNRGTEDLMVDARCAGDDTPLRGDVEIRPTSLDVEMAPEKALCEELRMCWDFERRNRETKERLAVLKCIQPEPPNL